MRAGRVCAPDWRPFVAFNVSKGRVLKRRMPSAAFLFAAFWRLKGRELQVENMACVAHFVPDTL